MSKANDSSITVTCGKCGLSVQVPTGGRRLCGCGTWLSGDQPVMVAEVQPAAEEAGAARWPRIEGDLSAIERLNDGYAASPANWARPSSASSASSKSC